MSIFIFNMCVYIFWKYKNAESLQWGVGLGIGDRKYSIKTITPMECPQKHGDTTSRCL